jgi:hypothetical protein
MKRPAGNCGAFFAKEAEKIAADFIYQSAKS